MMNYAQVTEKIEQFKLGKKVPDTERLIEIFSKINEDGFHGEILYIPGEYEYDSLGEFSEMILKEHKFSVGRFTSFAIKRPLSHILLNGKAISRKKFASIGEQILNVTGMGEDVSENCLLDTPAKALTRMDVYFLIALSYFAGEKVDYIILPSNVYDEMEALDENIEYLRAQGREFRNKTYAPMFLESAGVVLDKKKVEKATEKCKLEGKFELLRTKPYFIADGADNENATKLFMANLQYAYPDNPYIFIVGVLQDSYEGIVKESAYMAQHILTVTPPEMENALPGIELAKEYEKLNPNITNTSSVEEAVEIATILAGKDTVVAAFGTTAILERYRKVVDAIK